MNRISIFFLLVLCIFSAINAHAQKAPMADFNILVAKFKALKTYAYQTENLATFPDGHKEKMMSRVCVDGIGKRIFYKTDNQLLIMTGKWAFQANNQQKTVSVFDVVKYQAKYRQAFPDLDKVYNNYQAGSFLDSVVVKNATIQSSSKTGTVTTYVFSFPKDFYVKKMTVAYNTAKDIPESIKITTFYPMEKVGKEWKGTTYETTSSGYSKAIPEQVFDFQQYFKIQGGKVVLQQYKNYKLSAIL